MLGKEFVCNVGNQEQPLIVTDTVVFEDNIYLITYSEPTGEFHVFRIMVTGLKVTGQELKDKILSDYELPTVNTPPAEVHINLNLEKEETRRVLKKLGL